MIRTFRHKGLERFFTKSDRRGIPQDRIMLIQRMLDRLDASLHPEDMHVPGWGWHPLKKNRKGTFAVTVTRNWRLTFRFDGEDAVDVNLEDYH
ncbi:MAG: type II toxin-antitoxin system RelE/ParE family toxin [Gammaproteobacteria bacterium]